MENQFVVFKVNDEAYGVDIATVESIIKMQAITAVPHAPAFIEGVTNLRGTILPVMDLRKRFGIETTPPTKDTRIVVIEMGGLTVGIIVDAVSEVVRVPEECIEPLSPLVSTVDSAFMRGIAKMEDQLVILLDLSQVLSAAERQDLQGVSSVPA